MEARQRKRGSAREREAMALVAGGRLGCAYGFLAKVRSPIGRVRTFRSASLRQVVSRPGELHPQPLVDPYVTVSRHTAPIARPQALPYACQWMNNRGCLRATRHSH